jgi:hypothetical protein
MVGIRLRPKRPWGVRAFNAPVGGAGEASRAKGGLERGGFSLEGLKPSSEAKSHPRCRDAQTRQRSTQGALCPQVERGFCSVVSNPRATWRFAPGWREMAT